MEPLSDPMKDRIVKSVKAPPHRPLPRNLLYSDKNINKPDWKIVRDHLQKEGRISKPDLVKIIQDTNRYFRNESNILYLADPLTVVGDIHGQFYDTLKILEVGGNPDNIKYLFLGDFVDRGSFSIEVLILLYCLKLYYPDTIFLMRGNHECRQMTTFFNFRAECLYKYDQEIYELFMDSFDLMPLACIINGKFLALHGGLSPELKTLDDIKRIDRFREPPKFGIYCDLLWSDPVENEEGTCDNIYKPNDVRGCSYFYGTEAANKFLDKNNLLSVIRAHEAQIDGYKMHRWPGSDFPLVITIFSAPNYCDVYNNKGAVIKFENNELNIQQFNFTPHPYILPNFMDIFTWSIPFVAEKVNEMLLHLMKPQKDENDLNNEEYPDDKQLRTTTSNKSLNGEEDKGEILKNKIKFVTKMIKMNKTLREQNETIVKLKGVCPGHRLPQGILLEGGSAIKSAYDSFNKAKKADLINEKRPEISFSSMVNAITSTITTIPNANTTTTFPIGPNLKNKTGQPYPQISQTSETANNVNYPLIETSTSIKFEKTTPRQKASVSPARSDQDTKGNSYTNAKGNTNSNMNSGKPIINSFGMNKSAGNTNPVYKIKK